MTYIKISQLPQATGLTNDDYLVMVDEPNTAAITKKVKVEKIIDLITEIDGGDRVFNQDISNWNVSKVTRMNGMFERANAFQGSLSGWNLAGLNVNTALDNFMASGG